MKNGFRTYNYFIDNDVSDIEYTYSITAYDTGVMSDVIEIIETDNGWAADTIYPDPNNWGDVNVFNVIINESNNMMIILVKAIPCSCLQMIGIMFKLVPNPFILHFIVFFILK